MASVAPFCVCSCCQPSVGLARSASSINSPSWGAAAGSVSHSARPCGSRASISASGQPAPASVVAIPQRGIDLGVRPSAAAVCWAARARAKPARVCSDRKPPARRLRERPRRASSRGSSSGNDAARVALVAACARRSRRAVTSRLRRYRDQAGRSRAGRLFAARSRSTQAPKPEPERRPQDRLRAKRRHAELPQRRWLESRPAPR